MKRHFIFNINGKRIRFKTIRSSGEIRGSCIGCYFKDNNFGCPRWNGVVNRSIEDRICQEDTGFDQTMVFGLDEDYYKRIEII